MARTRLHPRLALPQRKITRKSGQLLDAEDPLALEAAGPIFEAGINQLAILERVDFVRTEFQTHHKHRLYLLLQGGLGIRIADKTRWLKVGELASMPAGTRYLRTGRKGVPLGFIYITLSDDERWRGLKKRGPLIRAYESADYLYLLTQRLLDAHSARDVASLDDAIGDSNALVDLLMRETRPRTRQVSATSLALRRLVGRIRTRPGSAWNNRDMARSVHMSERTFLRAFKKEFGTTPKTMIVKQRMIIARQRLEFTDDSVEIIARELGYANRRTFSDLFLAHVGERPAQIRRRSAAIPRTPTDPRSE